MQYTVTVLMNVSEDNFFGYEPDDNLATAPDLQLRVEATSWQEAAETAFTIGNRMAQDVNGRSWPSDVRSVSVGDVVCVVADGEGAIVRYAACVTLGFELVDSPRHVGDITDTKATSRTRKEGQ